MEFESWIGILLAAAPIKEPPVPLWAMELMASVFLYVWLFCLGASVGSFLNVVIYRLPRGKSLVHPGSICPHCGHAIRLHDNIPIFSWLALRGRCRDCQGPIASRYFFVELAVATIFLAVALIETKLTGGFPRRNWDATRWLISPYDTLPFWSAYGLHVILLTTLLGAALIDYDGFRTPSRIFFPIIALSLLLAAIWPLIHPQSAARGPHGFMAGLGGWLVGLAVGAVIGEFWSWSTGRGWPRFAPVGMLVAVGVVMGWRSLLEVAAVAMTLQVGAMLVGRLYQARRFAPWAAFVMIAALPRLVDLDVRLNAPLRWPANYDGTVMAICLVITVLATVVAGFLAPSQSFALPATETSGPEISSPS